VLAAGVQHGQNEQVGIGEKPFLRLSAGRLRCASQHSQMLATGEITEMLQADASQAGDFVFREKLLTRLNRDHVFASPILMMLVAS
jgi:hypothetical protein